MTKDEGSTRGMHVFLQLILKQWGDALNGRDVQMKTAFRGKLTSAMHTQTVSYIKPLFRGLKTRVWS